MKYAKTEAGQVAFKDRAAGRIAGKQRSIFIMFDGSKTVEQVLAATAGMGTTEEDVRALVDQGFLLEVEPSAAESSAATKASAQSQSTAATAVNDPLKDLIERILSRLPASAERNAKDVRMARDFMTNTVNTMFGQYTRLTFIEAVHACETTEQLRALFPEWVHVMSESVIGIKRLPELSQQLAKTL